MRHLVIITSMLAAACTTVEGDVYIVQPDRGVTDSAPAPDKGPFKCIKCFVDDDGDGHGVGAGQDLCGHNPTCKAKGLAPINDDCNDGHKDVYKGQAGWFIVPVDNHKGPAVGRGWDYNCDGKWEKRWPFPYQWVKNLSPACGVKGGLLGAKETQTQGCH